MHTCTCIYFSLYCAHFYLFVCSLLLLLVPADVLKIECMALYDYAARSDKELSFKKGDQLQVIEKTPDSNWWDGFHQGRRGFIPVSYVEIAELQPYESATRSNMAIPQPPQRKSSIHRTDESSETGEKVSEEPSEVPIAEERSSTPCSDGARKVATPPPPLEPHGVDVTTLPDHAPPVEKPSAPAVDKPIAPAVDKPATPVHKAMLPDKPLDKTVEKASELHAAEKPADPQLDKPQDEGEVPSEQETVKEGSQPPHEIAEEAKKVDKAAPIEKSTPNEKATPIEKPPPIQAVKGNVSKLKAQFSGDIVEPKPDAQAGHHRQRSTDWNKSSLSDMSEEMSRSSSTSGGSKAGTVGTPEDISARTLSGSAGSKQEDMSRSSSGGNKAGMPPIPPKAVAAPPPTRPKPPPTLTQPPSTPTTTTTSATPTEPSGAFNIISHTSGISPLQRAAAVAAVSAVVTPSKPPPPSKLTGGAASGSTGGKVKRNSSQKEVEKPAPIKPKAGDKTDMLRAELQAAVAKQGKPPTND